MRVLRKNASSHQVAALAVARTTAIDNRKERERGQTSAREALDERSLPTAILKFLTGKLSY
jgi:hypothetical protein